MIIAIHRSWPNQVHATHRNSQREEVLEVYPAEDFGLLQTSETCTFAGPLPVNFEFIRHMPTVTA